MAKNKNERTIEEFIKEFKESKWNNEDDDCSKTFIDVEGMTKYKLCVIHIKEKPIYLHSGHYDFGGCYVRIIKVYNEIQEKQINELIEKDF